MQRTPPPSPPSGGASSSSPPSSTFSSFAQRILGFLAAGAGGLQSILKPPRQTFKILVSGLDAAGKTSILYKLKLGEIVSTIPTIGFNVESITHKTTTWISWDVGGCGKILPMIRHYAMGVDAVLFVIDSNDRARLPEALDELLILLKVPPRRHRFLGTAVLANKQDLPGSLPFGAIAEAVGKSMSGMRDFDAPWAVFPSSIISGKGLWEALTWLQDQKAKRASADAAASGYLDGGSQSAGGPGLDRKQASANETPSASVVVDGLDPLPAPSYSTLPPREELMALVAASSDHGLSSTEFKERFERGDLEGFDHRAHLRAGYHILLRAMKEGKRDSEGTALFLHSLKRFIALAGSRVRNTFHV
ncbi:ADP-ribosylation factor family-domain-containing protein [Zopfochytrium polystomum]|nr:ADP-ribosylation factor family-domain-containing protein [Zopfochytrium polystomum]